MKTQASATLKLALAVVTLLLSVFTAPEKRLILSTNRQIFNVYWETQLGTFAKSIRSAAAPGPRPAESRRRGAAEILCRQDRKVGITSRFANPRQFH
jgi:hypothetical protein